MLHLVDEIAKSFIRHLANSIGFGQPVHNFFGSVVGAIEFIPTRIIKSGAYGASNPYAPRRGGREVMGRTKVTMNANDRASDAHRTRVCRQGTIVRTEGTVTMVIVLKL